MSKERAISVVRPSDQRLAVAWVLDVWASGCHFQAGLGSGDPEWRAIFSEPPPVPPLGPTVPACDRADDLYDASPGKYEAHPRSDVRVLYCSAMVESAKSGMPKVFTAYLLHKYPRLGRYAPQYRGLSYSEDPARSFIERGVRLRVSGFEGSDEDLRRFRKWLMRREREVKRSLSETLSDESVVRSCVERATSEARSRQIVRTAG